jgi:formate dehydrogenase major subunit
MEAIGGDKPFILHPDGRGWLYSPTGLVDGPLPSHYEPQESPVANPLYAQQQNPTRQVFHRPENPYHPADGELGSDVFPFVLTTHRLTEHHTAGGMSRTVPYLAELQPEFFCEVSPELAAERGDSANELLPLALDNNVHISEYKAATCDIRPGRRPRGPDRAKLVQRYCDRAGVKD